MILALDPGPAHTAYVLIDDSWRVSDAADVANDELLHDVIPRQATHAATIGRGPVVCEDMQAMGMAVGAETFVAAMWIGRYWQAAHMAGLDFHRVKRTEVKLHLCGSARAKDPNVRQALLDRFGPGRAAAIGQKKLPGPLYGVTGHCWSALAVAVTWMASQEAEAA